MNDMMDTEYGEVKKMYESFLEGPVIEASEADLKLLWPIEGYEAMELPLGAVVYMEMEGVVSNMTNFAIGSVWFVECAGRRWVMEQNASPLQVWTTPGKTVPEKAQRFRHFKGNIYEVTGVSMDHENMELLVQYRKEGDESGVTWSRPLKSWNERTSWGEARFTELV